MVSRVDFDYDYEESVARRRANFDVYSSTKDKGDKNVYFINGDGVFRGPYQDLCTIKRVHPTDVGFALMADAIGNEPEHALARNIRHN